MFYLSCHVYLSGHRSRAEEESEPTRIGGSMCRPLSAHVTAPGKLQAHGRRADPAER